MTKLRHWDDLGTARFVTFSCFMRKPYLNQPGAKRLLVDEIDRARTKHLFKIIGYVLMPEHVHIVLFPQDKMKLGMVVGEIKSRMAKQYFAQSGVAPVGVTRVFWQRRCYDHNCRSVETVREKVRYCHQNPVTRGLVDSAEKWPWSSYNWYHGRRDVPLAIDDDVFG